MARDGQRTGFSLVELLVVLGILSLIFSWAPDFNALIKREKQFESVLVLRRALNFARSQAVNLQTRVTLCAINQAGECQREWQGREFATFVDANRNYRLDDGEVLHMGYWPEMLGQLTWRAALRRTHISFNPTGDTPNNGSFLLCNAEQERTLDTVVIVNRGGRNYVREGADKRC